MIVTFDIETIPDLEGGRKLYGLKGINDQETAKAMLAARRTKRPEADFLPLHQLRIVAISVAVRWGQDKFNVLSLGNPDSDERELVAEFFKGIDKTPTLVSWNGGGFDLPVLQYRALFYSIQSEIFWDTGKFNRDFKWNNYQSRFHDRHVDVMEILSRYQPKAYASLDDVSKLMGLPGKIGIGGDGVFQAYLDGKLQEIRNYCEIDVLSTYLIFLRFEYIRGNYSLQQYEEECQRVRDWLTQSQDTHFQEFLDNWH